MPATRIIAIVTTGGGTKCAFGAGAMVALARIHGIQPDIIVAASGSAGTACYFASRQFDAIEKIWTKHLATSKFISYLRLWRIMNIDYVVDTVFKKLEPLDEVALKKSRLILRIPLLNMESKRIEYVNPIEHTFLFDILRAAKAMPFFYRKQILINGERYIDGGITESVHSMISEAKRLGATHIIVVDSRVTQMVYQILKRFLCFMLKVQYPSLKTDIKADVLITDLDNTNSFATTSTRALTKMFRKGYAVAAGCEVRGMSSKRRG